MARYEDDGYATAGRPQFAFPRLTPVVKRLLILNGVLFATQVVLWMSEPSRGAGRNYSAMLSWVGIDPDRWVGTFPLLPVWQLFTYGWLHSVGDPLHIVVNMLLLFFFGTMLEERLGGRRFFLAYVTALVAGGLVYLVPLFFGVNSHLPVIGASGAVFGVMVAAATLYPRMTVYAVMIPVQLKWLAIIIVGIEAYSALISFKAGPDGVAHLVHLGGAAYGFLAVRTGLIEKDPVEILERHREVARVERAADDEARMDRLLEKIHQEGMASLSRTEKDFLKRMSSKR